MVLQATSPTVPTQAPAPYAPATTSTQQFDMSSIMNMMMMMMVVVMMMKMMSGATKEMD